MNINQAITETYRISEAQYRLLQLIQAAADAGKTIVLKGNGEARGWVLLTPRD
jgi:hypothetical protein